MRLLPGILLSVLLVFSAAQAKDMSVEKVIKKTRVENLGSEGFDFRGPDINALEHDPYYVRSFTDPDISIAVHFVVVEYDFIETRGTGDTSIVQTADSLYKNFYVAVDEEGNEFELHVFHRDFDGCGGSSFCEFEEYFRITIPDAYFREKSREGITLYAKSRTQGALKVYLYPEYIQGILLRIEKERDRRGLN